MKTFGVSLAEEALKIQDAAALFTKHERHDPAPETFQEEGVEGEDFTPVEFDENAVAVEEAPPPQQDMGAAISAEIIQGAMAEAGRIMEDALQKVEAQRAEMMEQVQQEAQLISQDAYAQGREQGLASVTGQVREIAGSVEDAIARFEGERAGFEAEYEDQLKWLAIEIASKVLNRRVEEDDAEMLDMVAKAVQSVRGEPWIRVEVAQEMTRLITGLQNMYDGEQGIDVSAVPAAPGTIHIETPSGIVDASLQTQLQNLKDYFARGAG